MIRKILSAVSRQGWIRKLAMSTPILRDMAWHFVAGEKLENGLDAVRGLNAKGIKGTLNLIGTHVKNRDEVPRNTDQIIACLESIRSGGLDSHLSLKLTKIGLDVDEALCRQELRRVMEAASAQGVYVRIDMEESAYVEATLRLFEEALDEFPGQVGIVLQSYLHRNRADLDRMVALGAGIRLVKGGYWESPEVVVRGKEAMDAAFLRDLETALAHGGSLALATHDPAAIARAMEVVAKHKLPQSALEIQLLYGVRQDLAEDLASKGWPVRCYVPYGAQWYEYVLGCVRRDPRGALGSRPRQTPDAAKPSPAQSRP